MIKIVSEIACLQNNQIRGLVGIVVSEVMTVGNVITSAGIYILERLSQLKLRFILQLRNLKNIIEVLIIRF